MLTKQAVEKRINAAIAADVSENPTMVREFAQTKEGIIEAMNLDVARALQGESGPVLFPHLRGAVKDLIGEGKGDIWQATGVYMGAEPATTVNQAESNVWSAFSAIVPAIITGGITIWGANQRADLEQDRLDAQAAQTAAINAANAAAARAGAAGGGTTGASMFGGMSMGTILMIAAAGLAAVIILPQIMGGKKKR
jgi:hypothetical protein